MKARFLLFFVALLAYTSTEAQALQSRFGGSVAADNDAAFVSKTRGQSGPGTVYVFGRDGTTGDWAERQRLQASDAGNEANHFGMAMAREGNMLFVGAIGSDGDRGAVYVFTLADGAWNQSAKIVAGDAVEEHRFGSKLAARGNRLLVSAVGTSSAESAVYVFELDTESGSWTEHAVLRGSKADTKSVRFWRIGRAAVAGFGAALALGEHTAVISAPAYTDSVLVYSHDPESDTWSLSGELSVEGLEDRHVFGYALEMQNDEILVSAPRFDNNQGAVFTFEMDDDSGEWQQSGHLSGYTNTGRLRMLGSALKFSDGNLWLGAFMDNRGMGSVYRYSRDMETNRWMGVSAVLPAEAVADGASSLGLGWALDISGSVAVLGAPSADHGAGKAFIFENVDGQWIEKGAVIDELDRIPSIVGGETTCQDGEANLFGCSDVDMLSFLSVTDLGGERGVRVNDLWGWTDPETGKEWALIGRIDGMSMVDVSDPYNPVFVGNLPKTAASPASTWRDIKVYKDHAFIVADGAGNHGMQVFDLRQLRDVEDSPVTFEVNAHYTGIASAHNIVINEDTGFAFAVGSGSGGETCGGGLHMIDIRDPVQPTFAGCFADTETGRRGTGYSHDAQCVNYRGPDTEHFGKEICFGANETALSISDVSDKENPVKLANATYPNYGYSHQGWLTEDHRFFYMNDELDELQGSVDGTRTMIWDVSDLDDPQLAKEHISENKASDHNLYIVDELMYQSNYQSGLRVLDISDRENPIEVGYFDTVPYGENVPSFGGSWSNYPFFQSGIIVVTSGNEGMFILKKRNVDT